MNRFCLRTGFAIAIVCLASLGVGCSTDIEDPDFSNPFDPVIGAGLPVPESVAVTVGDNVVEISWVLPEGETVDEYGVFRKRTDGDSDEREKLLKRETTTSYRDTQVRNGRTYEYRIAAGRSGQFGRRTEEIEATPGLFTLSVQGDDSVTRDRQVNITFSARNAQAIQLSEDSDVFADPWRSATGTISWTLSSGDGEKSIYARFRLPDGSESLPARGNIRLDTKAVIQSVEFTGSAVRSPGDLMHVSVRTGENFGTATFTIEGVFADVPLFDDGTNGDLTANDGTYERDIVIPITSVAVRENVLGKFTDEAGNQAVDLSASERLTVRNAPDSVVLFDPVPAEPPATVSVAVRWSAADVDDFGSYKLLRSESALVDSTDELLSTITNSGTLDFTDSDVVEGETYFYRIFVRDAVGQETGSNTVRTEVPNLRAPTQVSLQTPSSVTATRIVLEWNKVEDTDFAAYRVYRNETGAVSDADELVSVITDIDQAFVDDDELLEDTTYYYRVYTVDEGGLTSRSNEVDVSTDNDVPTAVTLETPDATNPSRVALEWSRSTDADFQSYRVYRNEVGAVTDSDPLLIEISDPNRTFWDDNGLRENTTYYYRVYSSDGGGLTARSNEVEGTTGNEAPDAVTLNAATNVDSTAATLSWNESTVHDFASYQLYRDEIPTVTTSSSLVVEIDESSATSFRDTDLSPDTRYYYRVFVVDDAPDFEAAGSNIVTITTDPGSGL